MCDVAGSEEKNQDVKCATFGRTIDNSVQNWLAPSQTGRDILPDSLVELAANDVDCGQATYSRSQIIVAPTKNYSKLIVIFVALLGILIEPPVEIPSGMPLPPSPLPPSIEPPPPPSGTGASWLAKTIRKTIGT